MVKDSAKRNQIWLHLTRVQHNVARYCAVSVIYCKWDIGSFHRMKWSSPGIFNCYYFSSMFMSHRCFLMGIMPWDWKAYRARLPSVYCFVWVMIHPPPDPRFLLLCMLTFCVACCIYFILQEHAASSSSSLFHSLPGIATKLLRDWRTQRGVKSLATECMFLKILLSLPCLSSCVENPNFLCMLHVITDKTDLSLSTKARKHSHN